MQDSGPNGAVGSRLPGLAKQQMGGDNLGFSHGAFQNNQPAGGYGDRHGRPNIPAINTGRIGQNAAAGHDMPTPGTGFDMNYTPLLPSQLLLGSPFQPGSPGAFGTPQFQSISSFAQNNMQQHQGHPLSPMQAQQPLSPSLFNGVISPNSNPYGTPQSPTANFSGFPTQMGAQVAPGMVSGTSRTVYLGNIPPDTSAEEILGHVRSGQIESVRLLPDKNCAFISFLDGSSANHFHSDAILKKLSIRGQDIKIGWGKPSQVPTSVALAVQQSGASRNVYLGNLSEDVTEEELREDLAKFGPIDTVKIVREKAIGFVHFLSIGNAIKAVAQLPQEPKWQAPRRVYYGKDRCAYVSKTQQQNAAQYLGIAPGYAHVLNGADRDVISSALAQQSVAAAAVATSAGGANNLGNRTVYLGNIHPETTIEEICNVVRGGLLHHIRYIPDKHICFVTFIDPTSAASFYALSNLQGLMIHNRRLKIGWGKHSGALPAAIALAVSGGASRNVYVGNLDESWTEERLRSDFSEYGEIELVNALREKSCAFVNFTNIANAIKAIEGVRQKEDYKRFKVNFGKDRCGNPPRQLNNQHAGQQQGGGGQDVNGNPSPVNGTQPNRSHAVSPAGSNAAHSAGGGSTPGHLQAQTPSMILNGGNGNPLVMYLQQAQNQSQGDSPLSYSSPLSASNPAQQQLVNGQQQQQQQHHHQQQQQQQQQQQNAFAAGQAAFYGASNTGTQSSHSHHHSSSVMNMNGGNGAKGVVGGGAPTVGGMLAPSNMTNSARGQHNRAVSLPVFSQGPFSQPPNQGVQNHMGHHQQLSGNFGSLASGLGGLGGNAYGLAIQGEQTLPGWAEEEIGAQ